MIRTLRPTKRKEQHGGIKYPDTLLTLRLPLTFYSVLEFLATRQLLPLRL